MITVSSLVWEVDTPQTQVEVGATDQQWARATAIATDWLWALTGRRFGTVTAVWRPETPRTVQPPVVQTTGFSPAVFADLNQTPPSGQVLLMPGPVVAVTQVMRDGAVIDPGTYQLEGNTLRLLDGTMWPTSQNLALPTTAAGTLQITYTRGLPVPAGGRYAVGVLIVELAKSYVNPKQCRLPLNVQTATRNGTTISLDAAGIMQGFTGLAEVDQWVRVVNPSKLLGNPRILSLDAAPQRQTVNTTAS